MAGFNHDIYYKRNDIMRKHTTEEFKEMFIKKYGNLYNLDKAVYVNNKSLITVTCPIHGDFQKRPQELLGGGKCPMCSKTRGMTEDEFIEKATKIHNGFFSYENCEYKNVNEKVNITCPYHGVFSQKANNHLNGAGCPKCRHEKIKHEITKLEQKNKSTKTYDTETFIKKAKEVHGDKYTYEKTVYKNHRTKVIVTCPEHGDFEITPNHLLMERGCPLCSKNKKMNTEDFIRKAKLVYGDKYDYSKTVYTRTHDKVLVTCPKHGDFYTMPSNFLRGEGCPSCSQSKLEAEIFDFFTERGIKFTPQKNFDWMGRKSLDFYLPDYNVAIECQGSQHFDQGENNMKTWFDGTRGNKKIRALILDVMQRDTEKLHECNDNGVRLLYYSNLGINYPYKVFEDKEELLKEIKKGETIYGYS